MFEQLLAALAALQEQVLVLQAGQEAALQAKYDEGFAAGLAASGNDKIYSQAEADAMIANAVVPLQEQITALQAEVASIPDKISAAVAEAKAQLKASVQALIAAQQASESSSEAQLPLDIEAL